jgi:catechol 2,3-dioxygenase-like lactoylglutathione lyase family enzyme
MVLGINQVVLEVEDQDRALAFWTGPMGFELVQDARYGDGRRLEIRTPDKAVKDLAPDVRGAPRPQRPVPAAARPTGVRMVVDVRGHGRQPIRAGAT